MDLQSRIGGVEQAISEMRATGDPHLIRHIGDLVRSIPIPPDDNGYDGICARIAEAVDRDSASLDPISRISMRCIALGLNWPEYEKGSSYWPIPMRLARFLAEDGLLLNSDPFASIWQERQFLGSPGVGALLLGYAAGPHTTSQQLADISDYCRDLLYGDLVAVIVAAHPRTSKETRDVAFQTIREQGGDVDIFLLRRWCFQAPVWEHAYEIPALCAVRAPEFWRALLETERDLIDPEEFVEDWEDFEPFEEYFPDLAFALTGDSNLRAIALDSGWEPAVQLALAIDGDAITKGGHQVENAKSVGGGASSVNGNIDRRIALELPAVE